MFAILSQTVLKLGIQNLGSYIPLNMSLISYQIPKLALQRFHGENYMNFRLLLAGMPSFV